MGTDANLGGKTGQTGRKPMGLTTAESFDKTKILAIKNPYYHLEDKLVTFYELCEILGINRLTLQYWIVRYKFPRNQDGSFHLRTIISWARRRATDIRLSELQEYRGHAPPLPEYSEQPESDFPRRLSHADEYPCNGQCVFYKILCRPWSWLLSVIRLSKLAPGIKPRPGRLSKPQTG